MNEGERLRWEEIERRREVAQAIDDAIGNRADCSGSAAVNRDWLRYIAALDAGEAMAEVLEFVLPAAALRPETVLGKALAAWRQYVEPRQGPPPKARGEACAGDREGEAGDKA